ncbi:Fungal Zn2-Cys6 binuclear cluster domain-containing protein isoform 2 [Cladophialophora immunda]|nr:Fungal Zn2-Cys6 binuclear cluster domain-containing protein isoform 2 [Cladophialophora immunda]
MSEPSPASQAPAKRPRPVISCLECRRKKLRCSRSHPCQQCVKIGRPGKCEYQVGQEPEPNIEYSAALSAPNKRQRLEPPAIIEGGGSDLARNALSDQGPPPVSHGIIEDLQDRVSRLERALLAQSTGRNGEPAISQSSPIRPSADDFVCPEKPLNRLTQMSSQFNDACAFMVKLQNDATTPKMMALRRRLKDLNYSAEKNHTAQHSRPPPASSIGRSPLQLPPFDVCEKLAILYFDNMEHCFRILHFPEFRDQLRVYFSEGEHACRFGFVPQLVGVLAVAVILGTHGECEAARSCMAIKPDDALQFMKNFLRDLQNTERYRLPALQVKMLLLICGWLNLDPMDDLFRLNGELLRDALVMKMDQDPMTLPGISVFEGELRRRNWMTIVECDLMLSILCKMPCLVPSYTSKPPRNVNDEEIFEGMRRLPPSRPTKDWTDGLCQYLLAQSFPRRVAACKQIDDAAHIKTEDVLQHTRYLEKVLQDLPPPLRFNYTGDAASKTPPRLMARMELDISIRRPLMHLYSRCILSPDMGELEREVRAGYLQSCLMLANYQDLFDPQYSELNVPRPQGYWDFFYTCYRQELGQAILGICLEIKKLDPAAEANAGAARTTQPAMSPDGANDNSVVRAPSYTQSSLIYAAKDTLEPMTRRLPYRGSKVKDIVYYNIILTSLLPQRTGQSREAMILERLQELVRECQAELERAHVQIIAAPADEHGAEPTVDYTSYVGTSFDPVWESFPKIDIFERFDLDEL